MNSDIDTRLPFVIVAGLDLPDTKSSGFALDQALRIASRIALSQVHVVYAMSPATSDEIVRQALGLTQVYVNGKAAAFGQNVPAVGVHVRRGDAAEEIAQVASDVAADMIVVGTHKIPHLKTIVVGSTAERVMANARCPVLVAGPRPPPERSHVIVIEGPCPDCVRRRTETGNRELWCDQHTATRFLRRHVYSYTGGNSFTSSDMTVDASGDKA